ncbi:peptidylprolyl isomerase [Candidatus Pacearchaeota archaeon]|nr:peptidylprolyl isomerase [Candidatus Pacearchaeota archaeon]
MTLTVGSCVQLSYTGRVNGEVFDSTVPTQVKRLNPQARVEPAIVIIGQGMVVKGLDDSLLGKKVGETYQITLQPKEAFGERKMNLVKTIPLKLFTAKGVYPRAGQVLRLDDMLVRIITVSGARVVTDFNNPLAGKEVTYDVTIDALVTDEQQRARATFQAICKFIPKFTISDVVTVEMPGALEQYMMSFKDSFSKVMGKPLAFKAVANGEQPVSAQSAQ